MSESMNGVFDLCRELRPRRFSDVIGQPTAISILRGHEKKGTWPHAYLLQGDSGCGKTTLARIIAKKLGCSRRDFTEINAASSRGVDTIRDIEQRLGMAPMSGKCRVWLIDEAARLTVDAQSALLKIMEEPPLHVYFMLATTDPGKLLETVRSRCEIIPVKALERDDLKIVLERVVAKKQTELKEYEYEALINAADGSARRVIKYLETMLAYDPQEKRLDMFLADSSTQDAFEIVKLLLWSDAKWSMIAKMLVQLEERGEDPDQIRRLILASASKQLVKPDNSEFNLKRAGLVLDFFKEPFYDGAVHRLRFACWEVYRLRK